MFHDPANPDQLASIAEDFNMFEPVIKALELDDQDVVDVAIKCLRRLLSVSVNKP